MATATKQTSKHPHFPQQLSQPPAAPSLMKHVMGAINALYRFFASLKLAVISLSSLAASLAFATWLESRYGTSAAQDLVYQSAWFALLLAFLATNILCAALIRFPWRKRQTGFVMTHAGLLVLIFGAYWSFKTADEGLMAVLEGQSRSDLLRRNDPVIRVRELDPHTQEAESLVVLHFKPGQFPWGDDQAHLRGMGDLGFTGFPEDGCRLPRKRVRR